MSCVHDRPQNRCKQCHGSDYCEHNRYRYSCRNCKGKGICRHNRHHPSCSICHPDGAFKLYVRNASRRKHHFFLTSEEFKTLVAQPCFYCGEHEEPRGVDRWKNEVGYVFNNCRPCCGVCNKAKLKLDGPIFVEHFQRMADHTRAVELSDLQQQFEEEESAQPQ